MYDENIIRDFIKKYIPVSGWIINDDLSVTFQNFRLIDFDGVKLPFTIKEILSEDIITINNCSDIKNLSFLPDKIIGRDKRILLKNCTSLSTLSGIPSNVSVLSIYACGIEEFDDFPSDCKNLSCYKCDNLITLRGLPPQMDLLRINESGIKNLKYCPTAYIMNLNDNSKLNSFKGFKPQNIMSMITLSQSYPKISWTDVTFDDMPDFTPQMIKSACDNKLDTEIYDWEIVNLYVKHCKNIIGVDERIELKNYIQGSKYTFHKMIIRDLD
jgi:hypothetical protein